MVQEHIRQGIFFVLAALGLSVLFLFMSSELGPTEVEITDRSLLSEVKQIDPKLNVHASFHAVHPKNDGVVSAIFVTDVYRNGISFEAIPVSPSSVSLLTDKGTVSCPSRMSVWVADGAIGYRIWRSDTYAFQRKDVETCVIAAIKSITEHTYIESVVQPIPLNIAESNIKTWQAMQ